MRGVGVDVVSFKVFDGDGVSNILMIYLKPNYV
jgi:hypothetical protein